MRQLLPLEVSISNLTLQDYVVVELGRVTMEEHEGLFTLKQLTPLPYEKKNNVWVSVTIERDLDMRELERTIYTAFDFVSDVGGLSGFLFGFSAIIVRYWNQNSFDDNIAS